jgi:hypothetical protein
MFGHGHRQLRFESGTFRRAAVPTLFWHVHQDVHQTHIILSLHVSRLLTSAKYMIGYALAFCVLPAHFITHRLARADPAPPILSLSLTSSTTPRRRLGGGSCPSVVLCSAFVFGVTLHLAHVTAIWSTWRYQGAGRAAGYAVCSSGARSPRSRAPLCFCIHTRGSAGPSRAHTGHCSHCVSPLTIILSMIL